jgi:hypothetical protein
LLAFTWFLKHTSTLTYVKCLAQVHYDHGIWKVLGVYVAFKWMRILGTTFHPLVLRCWINQGGWIKFNQLKERVETFTFLKRMAWSMFQG